MKTIPVLNSGRHHRQMGYSATWRSSLILLLLFGGFLVLTARAFWIQGPGNDFYEKQGQKRFQRTIALPVTRGQILDRTGAVLATSLEVKDIWAIPKAVSNKIPAATLNELAKLLDITTTQLNRKLTEKKNFVYLKRQVSPEVAQKIAALNIPGIYQQDEYKRFYPEGDTLAHLIGFTNINDHGQEGIELAQEKDLAG